MISAAVPSPRIVAPENVATSACSFDSDLITVWWLPMIWSATSPTRASPAATMITFWCSSGSPAAPNRLRSRRNGTSAPRMFRKSRPRPPRSPAGSSTHSSTAARGMT